MTMIPKIITHPASAFPNACVGYMSPYPTVVIVTRHHQNVLGMESNGLCSYVVEQSSLRLYVYGHENIASDG
eukprot:31377-Pelagococcus_subviridis.AAC.10